MELLKFIILFAVLMRLNGVSAKQSKRFEEFVKTESKPSTSTHRDSSDSNKFLSSLGLHPDHLMEEPVKLKWERKYGSIDVGELLKRGELDFKISSENDLKYQQFFVEGERRGKHGIFKIGITYDEEGHGTITKLDFDDDAEIIAKERKKEAKDQKKAQKAKRYSNRYNF